MTFARSYPFFPGECGPPGTGRAGRAVRPTEYPRPPSRKCGARVCRAGRCQGCHWNDSALRLRPGSARCLLHRGGHIRAADALLFFFFFRLCDNAEGESGSDRCDCEQLWCIHGYLTSTDRSQELFEYRKALTRRKLIGPIAGHRPTRSIRHRTDSPWRTSSLRGRETQTEENKKRAGCSIEPLRDRFARSQPFAESGSEPRQEEAPDCASGHKGEAEH